MHKSNSSKPGTTKNKTNSLKHRDPPVSEPDTSHSIENDFPRAPEKSENVRVAVRIRPMNEGEQARGDGACLNAENEDTLSIAQKYQ